MQQQSPLPVEVLDVPNLASFGTFGARSVQSEETIIFGSAGQRKSRVVMAGLDSASTTSANVITVLESRLASSSSQKGSLAVKINQGSNGLVVDHETLLLDADGNFKIMGSSSSVMLDLDADSETLRVEHAHCKSTVSFGATNSVWRFRVDGSLLRVECDVGEGFNSVLHFDPSSVGGLTQSLDVLHELQTAKDNIANLQQSVANLQSLFV